MWPFKRKLSWPMLPFEEIKKRARVLVIDDSEFYYLSIFQKEGYNVDKWDDVNDLPKLESGYYDIILLDIQGIGKNHSHEQGLGILRHLHQSNPAQIVIAYSNADFSLKYQDFFKMADSTLAKSSDYVDFKRAVDKLLTDRFSLGFYVDRIVKVAGKYVSDAQELKKVAADAIERQSASRLENFLSRHLDKDHRDVIALAIKVVQVAISFAQAMFR